MSSRFGLSAFGVFLCFAALMAALAAFLLLVPGTPLDRLWAINPRAQHDLSSLGRWVAVAFVFLSALLVYTAVLWFRRRVLGYRVAVAIMAFQVCGDLVNLLRGDIIRGAAGLAIAAALLGYLLNGGVKSAFR